MSIYPVNNPALEDSSLADSYQQGALLGRVSAERKADSDGTRGAAVLSHKLLPELPSAWSLSAGKRVFDVTCVILTLPIVLPILFVTALLVLLTSRGPILFLQKRVGRHGRRFTILKFRTMKHLAHGKHHAVTTAGNQRFTPVGPFLRRWKLDELPQVLNVLAGNMSLVGPRPKLPEHRVADLQCRPGITGAATLAFVREEAHFARVPKHLLEDLYQTVVLPTKHNLDVVYMASASFRSDFRIITDTLLRRWDSTVIEDLLAPHALGLEDRRRMATVYQFTHAHVAAEQGPAAAVAPQD